MNKPTLPAPRYFLKLYVDLLPLGLLEAAIFAYVEQFEESQKQCFASREAIAEALQSSPRAVARAVTNLVNAGYLKRAIANNRRYLRTITPANLARGSANLTATPANLATNPGQSGRLLRSTYLDPSTKIQNTKINITRSYFETKKPLSDRDRFFNDHGYYPDDLPD